MKSRTLIFLSAAGFVGAAWLAESTMVGAIAIATHVLILFLHNIEVKVNRLLDDRGIRVTDEELAD